MKRFYILLMAVFCVAACGWCDPDGEDRQVLLIYFAGNNNLSSDGEADLSDIKHAWLPSTREKDKILLVFYHFTGKTPTLSRLSTTRDGESVEEIIQTYPTSINSATVEVLETVLADAERAWPASHNSLILWSHASGFLPEGYYANPQERAASGDLLETAEDPYAWMVKTAGDQGKSFGMDNGREIDIKDLAATLGRRHYDFLLFDCCLMANVEVAYELRNASDYLLFSPTEILADGFPYEKMMEPIFTMKPEAALLDIANSYMAHYRAQTGEFRSATVTIVKTSGMEALAAACKPVFESHQDRILTIDRSKVQPYFRFDKHWYYDLGDFVQQIATDAEYQNVASALNGAVLFKDATERFLGIEMKHVSGLSIYIPRPEYTVLNTYYKTLQWNRTTGLVQ